MIRLGVVSHHGRKPAGAEQALLLFLRRLPSGIQPVLFFFEEGQFTDMMRERYGSDAVFVVPMSDRMRHATRSALRGNAVWDTLVLSKRLADAFRSEHVDVVLTNSMKAHVVGSLAAKAAGRPCINYMHDMLSGSARLIIREISRYCGVERLACSHVVDKTLGLARTTVMHPPIDLAKYRDLPSKEQARAALGLPNDTLPVVALIGRIMRWKGQDRFIRIAARVLRETDAHFAIVGGAIFGGDADYPQELHDLVDRQGLAGRVHFVPWQEDMRTVYAAIDIACNCSVREPFGLTTVEALACEVPVICFDDAGVCEVFEQGRGGVKVPAGDESAFAAALLAYLRDPAGMTAARAHAREAAERLDVDRLCGLFIDVVSRVGAL